MFISDFITDSKLCLLGKCLTVKMVTLKHLSVRDDDDDEDENNVPLLPEASSSESPTTQQRRAESREFIVSRWVCLR